MPGEENAVKFEVGFDERKLTAVIGFVEETIPGPKINREAVKLVLQEPLYNEISGDFLSFVDSSRGNFQDVIKEFRPDNRKINQLTESLDRGNVHIPDPNQLVRTVKAAITYERGL